MKEYISSFRKTIRGRSRSILGLVLILCLLAGCVSAPAGKDGASSQNASGSTSSADSSKSSSGKSESTGKAESAEKAESAVKSGQICRGESFSRQE